jgi:hypothetical protein
MIRSLILIAAAGFVLSVATITAAVAIGGPEVAARSSWNIAGGHWGPHWNWDAHDDGDEAYDDWGGPQGSRTLAWSGDTELRLAIPAEVRFTQAPGAGSVTVSGPEQVVRHVVVEDGRIRFDHGWRHGGRRLSITMTAPNVSDFAISGSGRLTIVNYRQPRLKVTVSGSGEAEARGETEAADVTISGSGDVDLAELKTRSAEVTVSGTGNATVAPSEEARLSISGSGDINLESHPARLETSISGSGRLHQAPSAGAEPPQSPGQRT